ncbi:MAG: DPP IV N-terminal domain-containing protein [Aggregatilineales bacterium]
MAKKYIASCFLRLIPLITGLLLVSVATVEAQSTNIVDITLIRDRDSLTVFVPGAQPISLRGFYFQVERNGTPKQIQLESYSIFQSLNFDKIQGPICLRLLRNGSSPQIPQKCIDIQSTVTQFLADADVFWVDPGSGVELPISIGNDGSAPFTTCTIDPECTIHYLLSPTLTPTDTLTPTSTPNIQTLIAATFTQQAVQTATANALLPPTNTPNIPQTVQAAVNMTQTAIALLFTTTITPTPILTNVPTGILTATFVPRPTIPVSSGKIAFTSKRTGNSEIYVIDVDSLQQRRLTQNGKENAYPAWSPDGRQIAFESNINGNWDIYVMNVDDGSQQALTQNINGNYYPVWSPDGNQIAFVSDRTGVFEIYVMNANGSNQRNLTTNTISDDYPAWSPDGRHIVFQRMLAKGNTPIYIMDANGTNLRRLTNTNSVDYYPAWSPDGQQIAFVSQQGGKPQIYVMNANGSNQHRLTNNNADEIAPTWSPDGQQIAFVSQGRIYVINTDGSNQHPLTDNIDAQDAAAWHR